MLIEYEFKLKDYPTFLNGIGVEDEDVTNRTSIRPDDKIIKILFTTC